LGHSRLTGFIVMLFSSRDQRLGDMAAGALVLRERQGRALRPVELLVPPGCEQLVMTLDVGAMSADDYELVRSFLVRWRDFRRPAARRRSGDGGGPAVAAVQHPIPAGLGPDYYLACLGAAYQYRHQSSQAAPAQPQWGSPYTPRPGTTASRQAGPPLADAVSPAQLLLPCRPKERTPARRYSGPPADRLVPGSGRQLSPPALGS